MAKSQSDGIDEAREQSRDLVALRRLAEERKNVVPESDEWLELRKSEEALIRKIRDWASRSGDGD